MMMMAKLNLVTQVHKVLWPVDMMCWVMCQTQGSVQLCHGDQGVTCLISPHLLGPNEECLNEF